MLIMGIDPGTAITGYGVINSTANSLSACEFDCVRTQPELAPADRLAVIYGELKAAMEKHRVDAVVVEEVFFNKNVRTAMAVGQARGVILLAAAHAGIPVYEFTPLQVKLALVGYGRASKSQVQEMVRVILGLPCVPQPDDAADALGLAICFAQTWRAEVPQTRGDGRK